jgi:hypothetical protein
MQILVLPLAAWIICASMAPARLAQLLPRRLRRSATAGPWIMWAVGSGWLLVGAMWGWSLGLEGDDLAAHLTLALVTGLLLGLPAALMTVTVWRAALAMPGPGPRASWHLPPPEAVTPARDVRTSTPRPLSTSTSPLTYRRWRRMAVAVPLVSVLVLVLVVSLSWVGARTADADGAGVLPLVVISAGAAAIMYIYRGHARARIREGRRGPTVGAVVAANRWQLTQDGDGGLARTFPAAPFLRPGGAGGHVRQLRTVSASSGGRHWWAAEQRGQVRLGGQRQTQLVRSVWLVWLPGARLSRVMVTGRDEADRRVGLRRRLGPSLTLESDAFNERLLAVASPGEEAQATRILHPRMMELLMAELPDDSVLILDDDFVCLWRSGHLDGTTLTTHAALALGIADLIPGYALADGDSSGARALEQR